MRGSPTLPFTCRTIRVLVPLCADTLCADRKRNSNKALRAGLLTLSRGTCRPGSLPTLPFPNPNVRPRVVVPHFETKPGQQLFLSGSVPSLGEWEADAAVPLEWHEGHKHVAVVPLPPSKVVQAKVGEGT